MKRKKIVYSFLILVAILAFTIRPKDASAVPIVGEIGFGGAVTPIDAVPSPVSDWTSATGVDFTFAFVAFADGSYASKGFTGGDPVTFTDFQFSPLTPSPVDPLWTSTIPGPVTASFKLKTVSVDQQTATDLDLSGTGILSLSGFDDTPGTWSFSSDTSGSNFAFSSTNSAPVPEPGTIALLGIGLVGLVGSGVRRKMKKSKLVS